MNTTPGHILTKNFLAVRRSYFDRIVKPNLNIAQRKRPVTKKVYSIADKIIHVLYYGPAADVLSLALSHTEIASDASPDLTIHAWDSASPDADIIAPWDDPLFDKTQGDLSENFFGVYVSGEESLNFYDPETQTGYFWTYNVTELSDWVIGAPLRTIFHWFLSTQQIHLIHGAVIGEKGKSVLLTARSGSGKSTTSLSCLLSGMDYLADDYVAIKVDQEAQNAYSLYNSAKITKDAVAYFPEFQQSIWNKNFNEKEKAIIFLADIFPNQVKLHASLDAVLIPRITRGKTRIVKASKMDGMIAMAPTSLLQLPMAETKKISVCKDILTVTPCYFLELGPEVRAVPEVIKSFLQV